MLTIEDKDSAGYWISKTMLDFDGETSFLSLKQREQLLRYRAMGIGTRGVGG